MSRKSDSEPWRILLVENDSKYAQTIFELLSSLPNEIYDVTVAKDFANALDSSDFSEYDAILLDLSLPGMSGIEPLSKTREVNPDIPVIILSDEKNFKLMDEAMAFDANGYLPKNAMDINVLHPMLSMAINKERKLKQSRFMENRFKSVIENLEEAYYENDLKGVYTYVNKAALKRFGTTRNEVIGTSYKGNTPDYRHEEILAEYNRLYRTEKQGTILENELILPDGSLIHTDISVSLLYDENGKKIGFSAFSRDTTEKKLAHLAIEKSEEKYRNILANIDDGYFEVDMKGKVQFCNDSMCRILGYEREDLLTMGYQDYMDKKNAEKIFSSFNEMYSKKQANTIVKYEIIRKDKTKRLLEISISMMTDKKGKPLGFRGVARDLTEKELAHKTLRKTEERYREVLASIEEMYFEVDLRGRLTHTNEAYSKTFGYSDEESFSMSIREYMDEKNAEKVFNAYHQIFLTGEPLNSLQYEIIQKDKNIAFLESTVIPLEDSENKIIGFRAVARNITQRMQFIKDLEKAKQGAEDASLAKSEFLANMSHEIRTPMNGVLGMYNLLLSTELDSEQSDYVETGKRSAQSLLTVINDILDFSKIEAGKLDIETIDFDLRKSVEDIVTMPAVQAHNKGLEFAYQIENKIPTLLKGDPGRLRQIITNLSTNAIKFTSKGEVVFRISLEKETKTTATLHFRIEDTGIGISKKDQKRLFQSFQQVDASTTRKYGGTGLGLAIAKKLVGLMDGQINVESSPGKGSTFWFTCLFEKQDRTQQETYEMIETIQDKRILIVDDNQTNLDILSGYLKHWKCCCDQALSGQMGLLLMRAVAKVGAPYDLVISDMLMPEMDGAEFGRRVKADPELKSSQLIMLTSQGLRGDAAQMKRIGFSAYLNKPVRRSLLYDCLITVVNHNHDLMDQTQTKDIVTTYSVSEEKRQKLKILLVEDNPVNQKLAMILLKKFGFKPDAANNGKEAIKALGSNDYQVVLMDIQMPGMDGLEATKIVRDPSSNVKNHDVIIIAMTAHAMKGDRDMCLKVGMDDYIAKPINPEELLEVIEKNSSKL